jgi:hypothetical protein
MELGIYSFAEVLADPVTHRTISPAQRVKEIVEEIVLADQVGTSMGSASTIERTSRRRVRP